MSGMTERRGNERRKREKKKKKRREEERKMRDRGGSWKWHSRGRFSVHPVLYVEALQLKRLSFCFFH